MIHLHTIGDALIKVGDKEIRPTSPLVFAALLYLCVERGRQVPRAALQELLFPNSDQRSGAHSLRQLLYKLRQLGTPVSTTNNTVSLDVRYVQQDSVEDFRAHKITNGRHTTNYALLPNYEPKISERFREWLDELRSTTHAQARRYLANHLRAQRDALRWGEAEAVARALLTIDPLNEEATLTLAEATALSGAKTEALDILSRFERETGRTELRFASSVLRKRISDVVQPMRRAAPQMPFVGRTDDAAMIREQVVRARSGKPLLLVISGEAGIGKSRLLDECLGFFRLEGLATHVVRCRPHYASRPLSAFIELVPSLLASPGALGVSPRSLMHLRSLTSHDDSPSGAQPDVHDQASMRDLLLASIRDLVDAVVSEAPLLLAIEDVHWADDDSLRELSSLVDGSTSRPLAVLCTTRALQPVLRNVVPSETLVVRRLKALSAMDMSHLARWLLVSNCSDDIDAIASWCVSTAAGNALFLQMICAHYLETGEAFTVPANLVSAMTGRLELLPSSCRRILEFCALLGPHATLQNLAALSETTPLQLLNSVQRLEDDGYLQLTNNSVRLAHDLLSECTLDLVPPIAKRMLHGLIAQCLARSYESTHDAALLWDCADQWLAAGEAVEAIAALKLCARHAMQLGQAATAMQVLAKARAVANCPEQTAELIAEMMIAARAAGQWSDVRRLSNELSQLQSRAIVPKHTLIELLTIEAGWFADIGLDARPELLKCVNAIDAAPDHRIDAAHLLLRVSHEHGDSECAEAAYRGVAQLLDPTSLKFADRTLPILYHAIIGDQRDALELARCLVIDAQSADSIPTQFRMMVSVCTALALLGAYDEAVPILAKFRTKARELGLMAFDRQYGCLLCLVYVMREDFEAAERQYAELESLSMPTSTLTETMLASGLEIALWRGDAERARTLRKQAHAGTLRHSAYFRAMGIRIEQLDSEFLCEDTELSELINLYHTTKRFLCADAIVEAICEDLRRKGRAPDAVELIEEYLHSARRELCVPPPSFQVIMARCQRDAAPAIVLTTSGTG